MNPPEPRLNKIPFFITALVCFAVVLLIGLYSTNRFAQGPLLAAVTFLIVSITAFITPFLADYAADCREATARLSDELEQQIGRVQAASESLTRAASQIKAIEEAVHKSARDAETLPYRMAEKLAEFNESLAAKETEDREALELELEELRSVNTGNLKSVADKIQKATTDWSALELSTRKQLMLAQDTAAKIDALLKNSLAQIELRALAAAPRNYPSPGSVAEDENSATGSPEITPESPNVVVATEPEVVVPAGIEAASTSEPPKPKKPRPPRKPKPEDILVAMSESPDKAEPVEPVVSAPVAHEDREASSDDSSETETITSSSSSDGATRLLTTAYIGIGNKLYIRGNGPGLSWDKGVPMQFVSIGKWGWSTQDAVGPVRVKLFKNDEAAALTGEVELAPGRHTEITALF